MIEIVPFHPKDQEAVQALVLDGLVEHWGFLDETKNPDLGDIAESYNDGLFLVAWLDGEIVGSGAFFPRSDETIEVVRMSVAKHKRRQGIGRKVLTELCRQAYRLGYQRVILETTDTWQDTISFYKFFGFKITHYTAGDVFFGTLRLPAARFCVFPLDLG